LLRGANCNTAASIDDIDLGFDKLRGILGNHVTAQPKIAVINREVLAFGEAAVAQFV